MPPLYALVIDLSIITTLMQSQEPVSNGLFSFCKALEGQERPALLEYAREGAEELALDFENAIEQENVEATRRSVRPIPCKSKFAHARRTNLIA